MDLDDLISRFTASPDERWDICAQLYNALDSGGTEPIDLAPFAPSFAFSGEILMINCGRSSVARVTPGDGRKTIRTRAMRPCCYSIFWAMFLAPRSSPN